MGWRTFDVVQRGTRAPDVHVRSVDGPWASTRTARGRLATVLLFHHGAACPACRAFLEAVGRDGRVYRRHEAQVLALAPRWEDAGIPGVLRVEDPEGILRAPFGRLLPGLASGQVAVLVLDRFGAPWAGWEGEEAEVTVHAGILEWLSYLGLQCPE